jgi:hypothetical protein
LTDYFSEFDWYTPKHSSDEIDIHLPELDKLNIEVISNYEKFLKENIWLTKSYSTFTFEDLLACIPEFSLPLDFDYVQYKDPEALDRFYSLDQKLKFKYNLKDGEPYGKIPINDTITAVGLIAASDLHVYRTVVIVDNQGNRLDYFHIPFSFSSSNDYDETLDETLEREVFTEYTNTVITSDFKQIAKGWDITTIRDSLGNTINEIYSDTAVGISEIKEITQFLD